MESSILATATLALVGLVLAQWIKQIIYNHYFHPLAKFPGPFWAGVTRFWLAYHNWQGTEYKIMYDLHQKYGTVVRVTPTMLVVSDSRQLPEIYHRQADKSGHYSTDSFGPVEGLLTTLNHKSHSSLKRQIAAPYSFTNVKKLEPLVDATLSRWIDKLNERFAQTGDKFDIASWTRYMTYDIISDVGFGAPFGFVDEEKDVQGLIKSFHDGLIAIGLLRSLHPFATWFKTTFLGRYLAVSPSDRSGLGVVMRFRDRLYDERTQSLRSGKRVERADLLQGLLDARNEDGEPLDPERIKIEILIILIAGSDTTATSFQSLLSFILAHPRAYERMMAEIDAATRQGLLSTPVPQYDEVVAHCPYYIACVHEATRLCPVLPTVMPRLVSDPGMNLYGKFVPAGTEMSCNPWVVHRDKSLYGPDAEEFRPERWLDPAHEPELKKYNFGFGYGGRICLGKELGRMGIYKEPFIFFQNFTPTVSATAPTAGSNTALGRCVIQGGLARWEDQWITIRKREIVEAK